MPTGEQTVTEETPKETVEETPAVAEPSKVSLHIYMPAEAYEQIKDWAEYAALEGLIEGHPRGNFSEYCNFCFNLGEQYLKEYMLKKRGYK
ncbi:hypothetical protein ES703_72591 [subsurface metagenome]